MARKRLRKWGGAPGLLVVTQYTDRACTLVRNKPEVIKEDYATCCCIVQNLLLLLEEQGIATKWSTGPVWEHPEFRDVVGIPHPPPDEEVVALLFYGMSGSPKTIRELSGLEKLSSTTVLGDGERPYIIVVMGVSGCGKTTVGSRGGS